MCKDTTNSETSQEKTLFSFEDVLPDRKIKVDFNAPDISSNGGLVLAGLERDNIARKIARLIPDYRNQLLVVHSYEDMVCQRVEDECRAKALGYRPVFPADDDPA